MTLKNKLYIIVPLVASVILIVVFSFLASDFKIVGKDPGEERGVPEIDFRLPNGQNTSLKSLKGTPVLLNFWAAWCEPCLDEMPTLRSLEKIYKKRGLIVLAINIEDVSAEELEPKLQGLKLPENLIFNVSRSQIAAYKLEGIPVTILIDKKGDIKKVFEGPRDWDSAEMLQQLDTLLKD
ncbi:MAG: TlpA family protein disulfide reductase [Proteobacteria bacterium]|nr:TlpA family protein disulfide reductase [Pseudomonadota bacterium]NDC24713.1 TlpA family protein disulfide reductase [Pseudomonadota bacterium]NDD04572.1 TlpA family protein disulfide reductase [Pseudomonadota bacterium]NDG27011.1 TlpA family protein disulfide reductase [Pseudomonadota bacterium]